MHFTLLAGFPLVTIMSAVVGGGLGRFWVLLQFVLALCVHLVAAPVHPDTTTSFLVASDNSF